MLDEVFDLTPEIYPWTEVTGDPVAVRKCISLCTERPSANMTCNFHVLGTPIGDDIFVNSHLHEQAFPKLKQAIDAVSSLPDPQIAYLLLRHCVAGPKINHFNRTIPPLVMESFLHRFDQEVMQAFERITATQLNEATRQQVALPLNLGGLGLRSGEKHSFCAYISSILSVARNGSRDPRDSWGRPPVTHEPLERFFKESQDEIQKSQKQGSIEDMVDKELSTFKEKLTDREDNEMIHLTTDVFLTAEELENVNEYSIPKDLSIPSKKQQQEGLNQGYSEGSPLNMAKCVDDLTISHPSQNHLVLTEEFYSRNNGYYSDAESQHAPSKRIVSQSHSRPIGFPNVGNSCFLNAILRSLFCLDMFMIHVRTQHAFSEILNCIRKKQESIDNQPFGVTRFTVKAIRKRNRQYRTVTHPPTDIENRVVTFLGHMNCLADILEHTNSKQGTVKRALRGILDLTPLEKLRQHDTHEMLLSIFDLLPGCDDFFSFTVCNTLRCTHCDAVTRSEDVSFDLCLGTRLGGAMKVKDANSIPQPRPEWKTDYPDNTRDCSRDIVTSKLMTKVAIPEHLNMYDYCVQPSLPTEYILHAIVSHEGFCPKFGHYICDARLQVPCAQIPHGSKNNDPVIRWFTFNDDVVDRYTDFSKLLQDRQRSAYILFYQRSDKAANKNMCNVEMHLTNKYRDLCKSQVYSEQTSGVMFCPQAEKSKNRKGLGEKQSEAPDEKTMMTGTEERSDVRSAATGSSKARKGSKRKSKSDRKRSKKVGRKENMNGKSASSEKNDIKRKKKIIESEQPKKDAKVETVDDTSLFFGLTGTGVVHNVVYTPASLLHYHSCQSYLQLTK
ncbi:hypothetical protein GJ496_010455 [Pomphorhynchus laevis]|nr:hypothetical protein GJ496_010455 [Pomphorhynchus laevis]